jgi:XisI protein
MDRKIKKYQKAILAILEPYAEVKYSNIEGGNILIADTKNHRYLVMTVGFEKKGGFCHDAPMHMDIINGKIWVYRNMTEIDVGAELEKRGVPKTDIVVGYYSPKMREYTDYALG